MNRSYCRMHGLKKVVSPLQARHASSLSELQAKSIGVIGVGLVGNAVTKNLLQAGFNVRTLCDLEVDKCNAFPTCNVVDTARQVAQLSDIVITALPLPSDIKNMFEGDNGLLAGFGPRKIWIDHSTTDFEQTQLFEKLISSKGGRMLEAPVTGGLQALQKGQMTVFLAGDKDLATEMTPIMKPIYNNVQYTGPLGTAQIPKVLSNMLSALNVVAAAEVLLICKRAGVDLKVAFDCIRASSGNSFLWETGVPMVCQGNYNPSFTIELHCKDNQLGFELAQKYGVPIEVLGLVQQIYNRAMYTYGKDAPCCIPVKLLEDDLSESLQCDDFKEWTYSIDNIDGSSVIRHHNIDLGPGASKKD